MKTSIEYATPGPDFWQSYLELWENSLYSSVFQSPGFLRFLAGLEEGNLAVFRCFEGEKLIGAVLFKVKKGTWQFLSDLKSDYNFFTIHRDCSKEHVKAFFIQLFQVAKQEKWALYLDKQPAWASYHQAMQAAVEDSGMYTETSKYSTCLTLETASPKELARSVNKQKLRQKLNRMHDLGEVEFEIIEDGEDLELWMDDFIESHIQRWKDTPTPSNLVSVSRRDFLTRCMQAWVKDGLLVRFAIKLDGRRIGYVIALRENDSLIHYSTTYDLEYLKWSPGLVIIRLMGIWMAEQGYSKLNFGDGAEHYKLNFSNNSAEINRIYLSDRANLPFILKAKITKTVRENPGLHRFYKQKIKPLVVSIKV